jgi:hypothetical protein
MSTIGKQRCDHLECRAVITTRGKSLYKYCEEHTCKAFSASYGQCCLEVGHKNKKHASIQKEEWG